MSVTYKHINMRRRKVRYNSSNADNAIKWEAIDNDGAVVTTTSIAWATYSPDGTAITSGTKATSGNVMSLSLDTTTVANYPVGTGYRLRLNADTGAHIVDLYFDVVKHLLRIHITRDQLQDQDERLQGMEWAGDEEMKGPIEAARDDISAAIEAHVIDGGRLLENMILDDSRMAVPMKYLALSIIFRSKGNPEDAEHYERKYNEALRVAMSTISYDKAQGQTESPEVGGLQTLQITY